MEKIESFIKDPAEVLKNSNKSLDAIFNPKTVAVIGATERMGSVGRTVFWNLISNPFGGTVYPVNPQRSNVLGVKAYSDLKSLPEPIDLAVIVTPAKIIPSIISECADIGVKAVIIISAGFKELGDPGIELERQILLHAKRGNIRIIGPNCLGIMNPLTGLNATFGGVMANPGSIAFISQSGALCTAILDWSTIEKVGYSAFVSIGSMVDVDWGDLINYFGTDDKTKAIVMYMESIGNARSFISAAREVAKIKPIIVAKVGRTLAAAKAAASHTGSLTGSDDVLDAVFKQSGVIRVNQIEELFDLAEVLGKQPRPKGKKLSILTNAGGPGVLATDALIAGGGELAELSKESFDAFNSILPPHWSRNNPIDILGDAQPDIYAKTLEIAAKNPDTDGLLVILTPQDMTDPKATAEKLRPYAKIEGKPVLASWMGGKTVEPGKQILNDMDIPTYDYPDIAARTFNYMWKYQENIKDIYLPPSDILTSDDVLEGNREAVSEIIQSALSENRTLLTEAESKNILSLYNIPTVRTEVAEDKKTACDLADAMGYPVVLKLFSTTITHKTDVGGVCLNLENKEAVEKAYDSIAKNVSERVGAKHFHGVTVQKMLDLSSGYEVILGSSLDSQFGPVILFGMGGQLVEVFKDKALGIPPLTRNLARRMMQQTAISKAFKGVRGRKPIDMGALENMLLSFSKLVVEHPQIKECDINPLLVSDTGLYALDARFLLHSTDVKKESIPLPAIKPYPLEYVVEVVTKDGREVIIRPGKENDTAKVFEYCKELTLSNEWKKEDSESVNRKISEYAYDLCRSDYNRKVVLLAYTENQQELLAIGQILKSADNKTAFINTLITKENIGSGVITQMLAKIIEVAKLEGFKKLATRVDTSDSQMIHVFENFGFRFEKTLDNENSVQGEALI